MPGPRGHSAQHRGGGRREIHPSKGKKKKKKNCSKIRRNMCYKRDIFLKCYPKLWELVIRKKETIEKKAIINNKKKKKKTKRRTRKEMLL